MEPRPHYCHHPRGEGDRAGCPAWPACLFADAGPPPEADVTAERLAHLLSSDEALAAAKRRDWSDLGRDLATLAGWAAGGVLFIAVAVLFVRIWP